MRVDGAVEGAGAMADPVAVLGGQIACLEGVGDVSVNHRFIPKPEEDSLIVQLNDDAGPATMFAIGYLAKAASVEIPIKVYTKSEQLTAK